MNLLPQRDSVVKIKNEDKSLRILKELSKLNIFHQNLPRTKIFGTKNISLS